jgi:hypothetical protein
LLHFILCDHLKKSTEIDLTIVYNNETEIINADGSVTVMVRSIYNNETEIINTDGSVTVMVR